MDNILDAFDDVMESLTESKMEKIGTAKSLGDFLTVVRDRKLEFKSQHNVRDGEDDLVEFRDRGTLVAVWNTETKVVTANSAELKRVR